MLLKFSWSAFTLSIIRSQREQAQGMLEVLTFSFKEKLMAGNLNG
jgi:hypothetical protein